MKYFFLLFVLLPINCYADVVFSDSNDERLCGSTYVVIAEVLNEVGSFRPGYDEKTAKPHSWRIDDYVDIKIKKILAAKEIKITTRADSLTFSVNTGDILKVNIPIFKKPKEGRWNFFTENDDENGGVLRIVSSTPYDLSDEELSNFLSGKGFIFALWPYGSTGVWKLDMESSLLDILEHIPPARNCPKPPVLD